MHFPITKIKYRADPKASRNPNFCVGCFELIISKIFAAASKIGKNGQKKILRFFWRNPFLRGVLDQKLIFLRFFFCVLGIGVDSFCCYCKKPCTLDSEIAVHSYTGIQMSISWTLGLQSIAQISTNKHGSGLPVFQQTSSKHVFAG